MPIINADAIKGSQLIGADYGATVSIILDSSPPGQGPRLHRHPYDETWVVQEGAVRFQLGQTSYEAGSGDVVIAPPGVPHKFINYGTEPVRLVCIHASPTFITEWLE
jgi:quercetin dioxygenase-like cupin family protein